MAYKSQLMNFRFTLSDLNRQVYVSQHLIVPVDLPLGKSQNVLKLLAISLLSGQDEYYKTKFCPKYNATNPDVVIHNEIDPLSRPIWIFTLPLTKIEKKKVSHKMIRPINVCFLSDLKDQDVEGDLVFETGLFELLAQTLQKSVSWHIIIEGSRISVSCEDTYVCGEISLNKLSLYTETRLKQIA